jgi:hypothetical protein
MIVIIMVIMFIFVVALTNTNTNNLTVIADGMIVVDGVNVFVDIVVVDAAAAVVVD